MPNGTADGYVDVGKVSDFKPGDPPVDITNDVREIAPEATARILTRIETGSEPIAPAPGSGADPDPPRFFSIARTCTHEGCNVLRGGPRWVIVAQPIDYQMELREVDTDVKFAVIECPCHGSRFDLRTGNVLRGPAAFNLRQFATRIDEVDGEDHVFVAIAPEADPGLIA